MAQLLPENNNSAFSQIVTNAYMSSNIDDYFRAFHTKQSYSVDACICDVELEFLKIAFFELLYLGATLEARPDCIDFIKIDWSDLETLFGFTIDSKVTTE